MLTNITLENFKAFQKLNNLKVKPVTILCGTNSCGKSSILQSILLMKQTLESKNPNQNLLLNGRFVKLGYFQDIIHKKEKDNIITFNFTFEVTPNTYRSQGSRKIPIEFLLREILNTKTTSAIRNSEFVIDYSVSLEATRDDEDSKSLNIVHLSIEINDKKEPANDMSIFIKHIKEDIYNIEWFNLNNRFNIRNKVNDSGFMELRIQFENLLPNSFRLEHNLNLKDTNKNNTLKSQINNEDNFQNIRYSLFKINDLLQSFFSQYSYVGPLRQSHKDGGGFYFGDDITDIGNSGENAPFLFLKEKHFILKDYYFYERKIDDFVGKKSISLEKAFEEWFNLMGIEGFGGTETKRIINLYLNANKFDDTQIDISQVGFGVSQMFPIILEGLRMNKGNTLLLEQPEIHLHPNLQMQMADFFIALALSGKNVIAETHSDHIVNRLVRRIVEDETHNLKDKIGIYFIKPSENGSVYEEINIDEAKGITNWPVDFFDQAATEQMRIMQAGLKKRKNQRTIAKV